MLGRGMNRLCWAPRRLCLWTVFTVVNLSDRYSGTRLLAVLNIKDFNCLARLSPRLSRRRIWTDLTSQRQIPKTQLQHESLFDTFLKGQKSSRILYQKLISDKGERPLSCQEKWQKDINSTNETVDWRSLSNI